MSMLNEIQRALAMASIALSEQAGGDPPAGGNYWPGFPAWGQNTWTQQMIEMLGQTIMNTEQLGPWYQNPGQGNVQPGWTISQDADGGIGSGNIQAGFWADAWGYPMPLSEEHANLWNQQMGGENSVYWIGLTALMYAWRYARPEIAACGGDFGCVLEEIYAHFLRGPSGKGSKRWGKLADTGLNNFLNNWNALVEIITQGLETETEEPAEEEDEGYEVQPGDTLWGISNGNLQPWIDANPGINPNLIKPGQVLTVPK